MIIPQNNKHKADSKIKINVHILNFFIDFLSSVLGSLSFSKNFIFNLLAKISTIKKPTFP